MRLHRSSLSLLSLSLSMLCACSDDGGAGATNSSTGASTGAGGSTSTSGAETDAPTTSASATTGGPGTTSGATTSGATTGEELTTGMTEGTTEGTTEATTEAMTGSTTDSGGGVMVYDPNIDGPWQIERIEGEYDVDGVSVAMDAYYPVMGPEAGPYPVVVIAHGFQLPASQYTGYAQRLATHGYVALTADFQAGLFNPDHVAYANQVLGGIDWVAQDPTLGALSDTNNVGLTGHSLGGKLAVLGASLDPRVRASITLDPVDGAMNCDPQKCPDVTGLLPIDVPLGFLGETLDGDGFMACAPTADNFLSFYKAASAPALAVTVLGANHMSFLDDTDSCGFPCSFCKQPTLSNAAVNSLARAYVVAFYGVHLRGIADYETYLTGAQAQARYVDTNLAEIASK